MRVISQYTNHVVQIRPMRMRALGDGGTEIVQDPIYAVFTPIEQGGFLYENEKEAAEAHFSFHGLTQHEDEFTPSDVSYRLSIFDTDEAATKEGWDAETKATVEKVLSSKAQSAPGNIMLVATTPITAPFPAYDEFDGDPEQLVVKLMEDGHDLERVLVYERNFGKNREDIIEKLNEGIEAIAAVNVPA
jgi:hypothetical protein